MRSAFIFFVQSGRIVRTSMKSSPPGRFAKSCVSMNVVSTMYPGLPNPNAAGSMRSTERVVVVLVLSVGVCADNVSVEAQNRAERMERAFFMGGLHHAAPFSTCHQRMAETRFLQPLRSFSLPLTSSACSAHPPQSRRGNSPERGNSRLGLRLRGLGRRRWLVRGFGGQANRSRLV